MRALLMIVVALAGCSFDVTRRPSADSRADLQSDTRLDTPFVRADGHPDLPLHLDLSIRDTRPALEAKPSDAKKEAKPIDATKLPDTAKPDTKKPPDVKPPDAVVPLITWYPGAGACPSGKVIGGGGTCATGTLSESRPDQGANGWPTSCSSGTPSLLHRGCAAGITLSYTIAPAAAPCGSGEKVVGGGCLCLNTGESITQSYATSNGWSCGCTSGGAVEAYAVCAVSPPALQIALAFGSVGTTSVADCQSGHQLAGGGCNIAGGTGIAKSAPKPSQDGWECSFTDKGTAYAMCVKP